MKSSYVSSYGRRRNGRKKFVFIFIILLQLLAVAAYLHFKRKDDNSNLGENKSSSKQVADKIPEPLPLGLKGDENPTTKEIKTTISPEVRALISDARSSIEAGQLLVAKQTLDKAISISPDPEAIALIGDVNMKLLKSARKMPGKIYYAIQPGDSLAKIARKYHTTVALIQQMNGLSTSNIRAGDRLLVFTKPFSVRVSKSRNELDLMCDGKIFKRYSVGTGKFGKTPVATFEIVDKIVHPPWTRPSDNKRIEYGDPENLLGSRWMAIKSKAHPEFRGFGIHGTQDRNSIGKQSSNGCVRMLNEDVEELFDLLPRKTVVKITE